MTTARSSCCLHNKHNPPTAFNRPFVIKKVIVFVCHQCIAPAATYSNIIIAPRKQVFANNGLLHPPIVPIEFALVQIQR